MYKRNILFDTTVKKDISINSGGNMIKVIKLDKLIVGVCLLIGLQIVGLAYGMCKLMEQENLLQAKRSLKQVKNNQQEAKKQKEIQPGMVETLGVAKVKKSEKQAYHNMPEEIKGFKVVGKLEIPKIRLMSYILEETNTKSLKVSITKLCGPQINQIGNFCIAGHNYKNMKMFGGIKKLEKGDILLATDCYCQTIQYEVKESYQTIPQDVSCLAQETQGKREITLSTCTAGAVKRVIVKAIEIEKK